jgi:F-type H+-transporting ATPase subunit b
MLNLSLAMFAAPQVSILAASMGGGAVNIDFDRTVLLQMGLFALLIVLLKPLLLGPVLRVFAQREERTEGARAEARAFEERAGELLGQYESRVAEVQRLAQDERDHLRAEAVKLEAEILGRAREDAARIVASGRASILREVEVLRQQMAGRRDAIVSDVVAGVSGSGRPQ